MQPHKAVFHMLAILRDIVVIISICSPRRGTRQEFLVGIGYPACQSFTLSPQSPSLFPFFPIPYPFRCPAAQARGCWAEGTLHLSLLPWPYFFPLVCHGIKQKTPSYTQKLDFCLLHFDIDIVLNTSGKVCYILFVI